MSVKSRLCKTNKFHKISRQMQQLMKKWINKFDWTELGTKAIKYNVQTLGFHRIKISTIANQNLVIERIMIHCMTQWMHDEQPKEKQIEDNLKDKIKDMGKKISE